MPSLKLHITYICFHVNISSVFIVDVNKVDDMLLLFAIVKKPLGSYGPPANRKQSSSVNHESNNWFNLNCEEKIIWLELFEISLFWVHQKWGVWLQSTSGGWRRCFDFYKYTHGLRSVLLTNDGMKVHLLSTVRMWVMSDMLNVKCTSWPGW